MKILLAGGVAAAGILSTAAAAPAANTGARASASVPKVRTMVVFKGGKARLRTVRPRATRVRVGRRRCAVAARTPLAALVRNRPGRIRLRDFGSCSRRARDGSGLFVRRIRRDRNRGQDGWVYKVGRKLGTAGAADPSGPFGRGRLRRDQRVTWFYCVFADGSCQRTLELRARVDAASGAVIAAVRGYDNVGRGVDVEGATVSAGTVRASTGPDGTARLVLPPGGHSLKAEKKGLVRSFGVRVRVG